MVETIASVVKATKVADPHTVEANTDEHDCEIVEAMVFEALEGEDWVWSVVIFGRGYESSRSTNWSR